MYDHHFNNETVACVLNPRFPAVTWRHPRTKAVLLRASGFHSKGVVEMLKGKPNTTGECQAAVCQSSQIKPLGWIF